MKELFIILLLEHVNKRVHFFVMIQYIRDVYIAERSQQNLGLNKYSTSYSKETK